MENYHDPALAYLFRSANDAAKSYESVNLPPACGADLRPFDTKV
jgi:hypothetical protein